MGFTQQYILGVNPPVQYGAQLFLSWVADQPVGTYFQVYTNAQLSWWGQSTSCEIATPSTLVRIDVGTVGPGEEATSFASELPPLPDRTVTLNWLGGTFESTSISGFYVYGAATPGGSINYTTPLATIAAYTNGIVTDGFGDGGFGLGGFGEAAGSYSWTSDDLVNGVWTFAVAPFDSAGNIGPATLATTTIACPPQEPAAYAGGSRLHYTYNASTHEITLTWLGSPG